MSEITPEQRAKAEALMMDLYEQLDRYGEEGDAFSGVFQALDMYLSEYGLHVYAGREETDR